MKSNHILASHCFGLLALASAFSPSVAHAQLFQNLQALSNTVQVGNPRYNTSGVFLNENPKGMVAGDFDMDGKPDWAVSRLDGKLVIAYGFGNGRFEALVEIPSPAGALRQLLAADLNGDGYLDFASADPFQGKVYLFFNIGQRSFGPAVALTAWEGARNLAAGDFDGDGIVDLAVGGSDKDVTQNFLQPWTPLPPPSGPVVQPTTGVVQFKGIGSGQFQRVGNLAALATASVPFEDEDDSFPRPVYVLKTWRPSGQPKDWLIATHALASKVWVLAGDANGKLAVRSELVTGVTGVRSIALGAVAEPAGSSHRDLVLASRDLGTIEVHRTTPDGLGFLPTVHQKFDMPGGPRALELADMNSDGWNELVVVARYFDRLITFKNTAGQLAVSSEAQTGLSPRELAAADFDRDGRSDFVVLNRQSTNVSVLVAAADSQQRTGFAALDQVYPVDGDIAQLGLYDLNGDGRKDVMQLHRASAEVSVRMSGPNGKLSDPAFYKMGDAPSSFSLGDVNNDGKLDLISANLGSAAGGAIVVRNGTGTGTFSVPETYFPPTDPIPPASGGGGANDPDASLPPGIIGQPRRGRLYAVLSVDLDGDGIKDLAAGYYDCRIIFFKGDASGHFTPTQGFSDHELYTEFGYEARFIVAGDFDQDGDNDLAAAAWPGDVVVLENTGNFFGTVSGQPFYRRHFFPRYNNQMAQARDIAVQDVNSDGDPDIIVGTGAGAQVMLGKPGMAFERKMYPTPGGNPNQLTMPVISTVSFPVGAMVTGDLDSDGDDDMAAICAADACLHILTKGANGSFLPALVVNAPLTSCLAAGDVDGDGKVDLVGTGSVLWVALSSHQATTAPPLTTTVTRPTVPSVVINEILANNSNVPVPDPRFTDGRIYGNADAIEFYNGGTTPVTLNGSKLQMTTGTETKEFSFPPSVLPPGGRQLVIATTNTSGNPWATGFALPKTGATLTLTGPSGAIDTIEYPRLAQNQSYARFADGDAAFHVNQLPDPGRTNLDNGPVEPGVTLTGVSLGRFKPGELIRFYAKAKDDVGIVGLILKYRVRGVAAAPFKNVLLYDDGQNGDGGRLDGIFSGLMDTVLPDGTQIEFYLEGEDLSGAKKYIPGLPPEAADETNGTQLYTLTIPGGEQQVSGLEISEAVANNTTGLTDERNQIEDWIEFRNTTNFPLQLGGLELTQGLFDSTARFVFPLGFTLAPHAYVLVFCDEDNPTNNVLHAPFRLSGNDGEELHLVGRSAEGTQQILDYIQIPVTTPNSAYSRMGVGGQFVHTVPTPGKSNAATGGSIFMVRSPAGNPESLFAFSGLGRIESSLDLRNWTTIQNYVTDDGTEHIFRAPLFNPRRFFRVR